MNVEHNSRLEIYRNPFGAVTSGTNVRLRLAISDGGVPEFVRVHCFFKNEEKILNMAYVFEISNFCFYESEIKMPDEVGNLWYYFEIVNSLGSCFYSNNQRRLGGIGETYNEKPQNMYQITVYSPNYKTPEWFRKSVVYQIFPDRFLNGNDDGEFLGERTDIIKRNWKDMPYYKKEQFGDEYLANDFFGGNILGIIKKLDYLKELGVDAIYLNPIFEAFSNHKYDTADYMKIDSSFGTNEDFEILCKKAEEYGIKIILDGVFNHTGSNSVYFNKNGNYDSIGAYQSKESEYFDWFCFDEWPDNYKSWWGIDTLPSVNENSEGFCNYIFRNKNSVVKHWIKKGASGWRLDVVDELPDFFVKELRKAVKGVCSDAVIIGEVWEDASNKESYGEKREYLLGDELDSVMNYPLRLALIDFAKGKIDAKEFDDRIMSLKENYPKPAYYSLLNFLSTHDVKRIITAVSDAPDNVDKDFMANYKLSDADCERSLKKVKQIVMMLMLMPGVPCIYYGDEIGMQGYADPFCRQCYDWDEGDNELRKWYTDSIALRKSSDAFISGEFECVYKVNRGYAFIRRKNNDLFVVCSNFSNFPECFRLDVARFGINKMYDKFSDQMYESVDGIYYIDMDAEETRVYKCE